MSRLWLAPLCLLFLLVSTAFAAHWETMTPELFGEIEERNDFRRFAIFEKVMVDRQKDQYDPESDVWTLFVAMDDETAASRLELYKAFWAAKDDKLLVPPGSSAESVEDSYYEIFLHDNKDAVEGSYVHALGHYIDTLLSVDDHDMAFLEPWPSQSPVDLATDDLKAFDFSEVRSVLFSTRCLI